MDLALHLGRQPDELARSMSELQFIEWQRYAARRMFPIRRMEMHLAQLSMLIAQLGGNTAAKLSDFLFDPAEEGDDVEDAKSFFGFDPVKKPPIE